jgi:predicted nucleic acid-binding protein
MTSSVETTQQAVLLDANVLSRLAHIGKADLLPATLPNRCTISPTIYRELEAGINSGAPYLQAVTALVQRGEIRVLDLEDEDQELVASVPRKLARGEAEGIALCKRLDMVFVTHDRKAANYCERAGVTCLHFSILIGALHKRGLLTDTEAKQALA